MVRKALLLGGVLSSLLHVIGIDVILIMATIGLPRRFGVMPESLHPSPLKVRRSTATAAGATSQRSIPRPSVEGRPVTRSRSRPTHPIPSVAAMTNVRLRVVRRRTASLMGVATPIANSSHELKTIAYGTVPWKTCFGGHPAPCCDSDPLARCRSDSNCRADGASEKRRRTVQERMCGVPRRRWSRDDADAARIRDADSGFHELLFLDC